MATYRIYYRMDGDVLVKADSEEEARERFYDISPTELAGNTYHCFPEIDDLCQEDE